MRPANSIRLRALLSAAAMVAGLLGCKPSAETSARVAPAAATVATEKVSSLRIAFRFTAGGKVLGLNGRNWISASGQSIEIARAAMLLSGLQLCSADGACVALVDVATHLDLQSDKLHVNWQALPERPYERLAFQVGLPPAINHGDPAQYAPGHALHPLENGLHWSWQGGYVFAALEGHYAKSTSKPGQPTREGFVYHVANDANVTAVTLPLRFVHDGRSQLSIDIDVGRLVDVAAPGGIAPGENASTHSRSEDAVLQRVASALPSAFAQSQATASDLAGRPPASVVANSVASGTYRWVSPAGFPQASLPADNPLTEAGVALGKRLFSDRRLSKDKSVSCATCHQATLGFSEAGRKASRGVGGRVGTRRAMPLTNLAWASHLAWDGKQTRISEQAFAALFNADEMAMQPAELARRVSSDTQYRKDFAAAFNGAEPDVARIGLALEQFVLTLTAGDSRVDRAMARQLTLSEQELHGLKLFMSEHDPARGVRGGDCFHCHGGPLFTSGGFHNNGLDATFKDVGRMKATGREGDAGKFKAPSLRNVALRPPYMHDGRFKTLEAVVEHYSSGTVPSATLDPNIAKHPNQAGLGLETEEKAALVALLRALTDDSLQTRAGSGRSKANSSR